MTGREARSLFAAGKIKPLGTTGKVWQWVEQSMTHSCKSAGRALLPDPRGAGKYSTESADEKFPPFLANEMALRPSWDLA